MPHTGDNAEHLLIPHRPALLGKAGVAGYSTTYHRRIRAGQPTDEVCLRIYVRRKVAISALSLEDTVPADIDGVPTDVVEVGEVVAQPWPFRRPVKPQDLFGPPGVNIARVRPVKPGYSVGHYRVTAGTLGAIGLYQNWPVIISNAHVLANSATDTQPGRAALYDAILQPGVADGGQDPADMVAWLAWWELLKVAAPNYLDAACAWMVTNVGWEAGISGAWVRGRREAEVGLPTHKTGRTTGLTAGKRITDPAAVLQVNYGEIGTLLFEDLVLTEPQSQGGDSGSLVLSEDNMALGLLFAGSPSLTAMCKLRYLPPEITIVGAV